MALQSLASNATRLSQRIQENFKESTRDLPILQGNPASSAAYFDYSGDKLKDISKLLDSRLDQERLEGMKRLIAMISKGRDMEAFFAQVVKNVASPSIEIRKLVYIYLLRYASSNPDLLLLSINTFQKDLSDHSPLIRSMSLRVLTSIRLPVIQGIVMIGLNKLVKDRNPWVRKSVAGGLAKVYDMDATTQPLLIPILETLLSSHSPITLGSTLTAWHDICPDNLAMLHPHYRRICRLLVDADEWGQTVALDVLLRYARAMLEKPESAGPVRPEDAAKKVAQSHEAGEAEPKEAEAATQERDDEPDDDDIDQDIYLLLFCAKPLLQSRNPSVVLGTVRLFYHLAPASHPEISQQLLVQPLLRLVDGLVRPEIASLAVEVCQEVAEERPWLFTSWHTRFLLRSTDSIRVKRAKIAVLRRLISADTAPFLIREFKQYARSPQVSVSQDAIDAIGHCASTQPEVHALGLGLLMRHLRSSRDSSVAQAVIVLKSLIQSSESTDQTGGPAKADTSKLVAKLVRQLDAITNPSARACVFWLAGQYAGRSGGLEGPGPFEELARWAPDTLRKGVKGFLGEASITKLQILTLAAKLVVLCPAREVQLLAQYALNLARYDADWDVRDRGRFLNGLLRGVRQHTENGGPGASHSIDDDEEEDVGGVILRREQIKLVLLGDRTLAKTAAVAGHRDGDVLPLGSLSSWSGRRLQGCEPLPRWSDDPTDPTLRDTEEESQPTPPPAMQWNPSFQATPRISSPALATSRASASPGGTSPGPGSTPSHTLAKGKFKDLDAFLDESTEEEESDDDDDGDENHPVHAANVHNRAPAQPSTFVPPYDEDDTSSEDEVSEEAEASSDEDAELLGRDRG